MLGSVWPQSHRLQPGRESRAMLLHRAPLENINSPWASPTPQDIEIGVSASDRCVSLREAAVIKLAITIEDRAFAISIGDDEYIYAL